MHELNRFKVEPPRSTVPAEIQDETYLSQTTFKAHVKELSPRSRAYAQISLSSVLLMISDKRPYRNAKSLNSLITASRAGMMSIGSLPNALQGFAKEVVPALELPPTMERLQKLSSELGLSADHEEENYAVQEQESKAIIDILSEPDYHEILSDFQCHYEDVEELVQRCVDVATASFERYVSDSSAYDNSFSFGSERFNAKHLGLLCYISLFGHMFSDAFGGKNYFTPSNVNWRSDITNFVVAGAIGSFIEKFVRTSIAQHSLDEGQIATWVKKIVQVPKDVSKKIYKGKDVRADISDMAQWIRYVFERNEDAFLNPAIAEDVRDHEAVLSDIREQIVLESSTEKKTLPIGDISYTLGLDRSLPNGTAYLSFRHDTRSGNSYLRCDSKDSLGPVTFVLDKEFIPILSDASPFTKRDVESLLSAEALTNLKDVIAYFHGKIYDQCKNLPAYLALTSRVKHFHIRENMLDGEIDFWCDADSAPLFGSLINELPQHDRDIVLSAPTDSELRMIYYSKVSEQSKERETGAEPLNRSQIQYLLRVHCGTFSELLTTLEKQGWQVTLDETRGKGSHYRLHCEKTGITTTVSKRRRAKFSESLPPYAVIALLSDIGVDLLEFLEGLDSC